jgi:hypothetical protein
MALLALPEYLVAFGVSVFLITLAAEAVLAHIWQGRAAVVCGRAIEAFILLVVSIGVITIVLKGAMPVNCAL